MALSKHNRFSIHGLFNLFLWTSWITRYNVLHIFNYSICFRVDWYSRFLVLITKIGEIQYILWWISLPMYCVDSYWSYWIFKFRRSFLGSRFVVVGVYFHLWLDCGTNYFLCCCRNAICEIETKNRHYCKKCV